MSKQILGVVFKEKKYYDPDPGNPMSRDIETTKEIVELFYNEKNFAKKLLKLKEQKKDFKCFKGEFIETPEVSISLKI